MLYPGTAGPDGGFTIAGVPAGESYVNLGAYALFPGPSYYWLVTPSRSLDLSEYLSGRPDVVFADGGQSLQLNIGGLAPWNTGDAFTSADTLSLASQGGDQYSILSLNVPDGGVVDNETQAYGQGDWNGLLVGGNYTQGGLIDALAGDQTYLVQTRSSAFDAGVSGSYAVAATAVSGFSEPGLGAGALNALMSSRPVNSVSALVHAGQFAGYASQVYPGSTDQGMSLTVTAASAGAASLNLLTLNTAPSTGDYSLQGSYVNPLPSSWPEVGYVQDSFDVRYPLPNPDGGTPFQKVYYGSLFSSDLATALFTAPLAPKLGPINQLLINGQPATGTLNGVGLTPLVSWTAPSTGQATWYQLSIRAFIPRARGYGTAFIALFRTTNTHLRIPPSLMIPGRAHVLHIWAYQAPNDDVLNRPYAVNSLPNSGADTWSPLLYP